MNMAMRAIVNRKVTWQETDWLQAGGRRIELARNRPLSISAHVILLIVASTGLSRGF